MVLHGFASGVCIHSFVAAFLCFSVNRRIASGQLFMKDISGHLFMKDISLSATCASQKVEELCITSLRSDASWFAPSLAQREIPLCHVKYKSK